MFHVKHPPPFKKKKSIAAVFFGKPFYPLVIKKVTQAKNLIKEIDNTDCRKKGGKNMKNLPSDLQKEPSYLSEKSQQNF